MTTAVQPIAAPVAKRRRWDTGQLGVALVFLAPAMIGFFLFYFRSTVLGFWNSFTDKELLRPTAEWVGLENYREMLDDDVFWNALRVTLKYVVINIGVQTICAIAIAWVLDRLSSSRLLRTVVMTPWLMANVVAAMLFLWILDFRLGVMNVFLEWIGIGAKPFFTSSVWAIPSIAFINVWRHMGYTVLLLFAGLQTIPKSVKEAALVDGCGEAQRFFRVDPAAAASGTRGRHRHHRHRLVPDLRHRRSHDEWWAGQRLPASSTSTSSTRRSAGGTSATPSAMSVVLFLILAVVTFAQMRLLRANESDLA